MSDVNLARLRVEVDFTDRIGLVMEAGADSSNTLIINGKDLSNLLDKFYRDLENLTGLDVEPYDTCIMDEDDEPLEL